MTNLRIRPAVASLPRYVPSKTAPDAVKISSNEMPTPPSPEVLEAIARELETINRYPDLTAAPLREALAQRFGVHADQVCVGTGSSAILVAALSAVCQPGSQVVFPWRSFESYPIAIPSVGGDPVPVELLPDGTHDLDAMRAAITPDTVAVIVCSPNNPTGPALTYEEIAGYVADVPDDVMIIVDEAYIDFATKPGVRTAVPLIEEHPNVIVMRTFSKAHALAGVRVGYAIGDPEGLGATQGLVSGGKRHPIGTQTAFLLGKEDLVKAELANCRNPFLRVFGAFIAFLEVLLPVTRLHQFGEPIDHQLLVFAQ